MVSYLSCLCLYCVLNILFHLCEGPSTFRRLQDVLLNHVDIDKENVFTIDPAVNKTNMADFCGAYLQKIEEQGGLDLVVCEFEDGLAGGGTQPHDCTAEEFVVPVAIGHFPCRTPTTM